ncbi:hypothetical protein PRIEUP_LOCUS1601 [Pristimantis euphronides]
MPIPWPSPSLSSSHSGVTSPQGRDPVGQRGAQESLRGPSCPAVRGGTVVRPGEVPAGGSARSRRTTSAEVANKRSRRQPAGAHRRARDDGRRHRGRGRAPWARQDTMGPFSTTGTDGGGDRDSVPEAPLESGMRAVRGLFSSSLAPVHMVGL